MRFTRLMLAAAIAAYSLAPAPARGADSTRSAPAPDTPAAPRDSAAAAPRDTTRAAPPPGAAALPPDTSALRLREIQVIGGGDLDLLAEPSGVLVDAFGRTWVSDASHHLIRRWDARGALLDETGTLGSEPGRFRRPASLARLGSLGVAVLDAENLRVSTYDHHLRLLGVLVDLRLPALESRVGRVLPVALASDRGGALYLADADRDRILAFDFAGTFLRELGGFTARAGGFSGLQDIACGPHGRLVTVERPRGGGRREKVDESIVGRARIQWLDTGGLVVGAIWTPRWRAGSGETRLSLAVDESGLVAVAGERSGQLFVLAADGRLLASLTDLGAPRALSFAPDGTLLVAEAGAHRVRRFALERPKVD